MRQRPGRRVIGCVETGLRGISLGTGDGEDYDRAGISATLGCLGGSPNRPSTEIAGRCVFLPFQRDCDWEGLSRWMRRVQRTSGLRGARGVRERAALRCAACAEPSLSLSPSLPPSLPQSHPRKRVPRPNSRCPSAQPQFNGPPAIHTLPWMNDLTPASLVLRTTAR